MPKEVALFVTCLIDGFRPQVGIAAVTALERQGWTVVVPREQTCCGQFAFNGGHRQEARRLAEQWMAAFTPTAPSPIVGLSGSCVGMVRHAYSELLANSQWASQVTPTVSRLQEFAQFVVATKTVEPAFPAQVKASVATIAVHHGCHMRRLLGDTTAVPMLCRQLGWDVRELDDGDQCCGFGGTYGWMEPVVATALADAKLEAVAAARRDGAQALVAADLGCLLHLAGRLSRRGRAFPMFHVAEVMTDLIFHEESPAGQDEDRSSEAMP